MTTLLEAALDYAQGMGWPVFPCIPGTKQPATQHGHRMATTNEDQIRAWWSANPNFNIAFAFPPGWCAIDADTYNLAYEKANLDKLALPPTWMQRSPRGGFHYIFRGDLRNTQGGKLGKGIDTRGPGGYILLAPSRTEHGQYQAFERKVAHLPPHIAPLLDQPKQYADVEQDTPFAINRARTFLNEQVAKGNLGIEGQGSDSLTFKLASRMIGDLNLSTHMAASLLFEDWNPFNPEPFEEDWIWAKVVNAAEYCQNSGSQEAIPPSEKFDVEKIRKAQEIAKDEAKAKLRKENRFMQPHISEILKWKPAGWLIPNLVPENAHGALVAPMSSFKTFLAVDIALTICTGLEGCFGAPDNTGSVFYGAHEGFEQIVQKQYYSWCIDRGLDPMLDHHFYPTYGPLIRDFDADFAAFADYIDYCMEQGAPQPRLLVLDTFSSCLTGYNELDSIPGGLYSDWCKAMMKRFKGMSILTVGHNNKAKGEGLRGNGGVENGLDFVIDANREDIESTRVSAKVRKMKHSAENKGRFYLIGQPVENSLVFRQSTAAASRSFQEHVDPFSTRKIVKVLKELGATLNGTPISTEVLARHITREDKARMSPACYEGEVSSMANGLMKHTKTTLKDLCQLNGKSTTWRVPAEYEKEEGA